MKNIVIVGATSLLAQHCARIWVARGAKNLILLGRDAGRLDRIGADLLVRGSGCTVRGEALDFLEPAAIARAVARAVESGPIDIVLIAHGSLPDHVACQDDLGACRDALMVNGMSPVLFAEAFAKHLAAAGRGTLALIGSVAGDRGRKSNYVYGSAKGLLERFAQGLQHRFAQSSVKVVLIKPGPTHTPMTAALHAKGAKLASPSEVAQLMVDGIDAGRPVVYAPRKWSFIMLVLRHLPRLIFNRLNI